ncbi:MAG: RNA 2',3'-cyclic phosphodiesterase [Clostridia bacterium]|nr:RNA 2',3'-cyclic phosphodiesterase [Clostridia bacterium]
MRLFVAINFEERTVNRLLALRNILRMKSASGRFSEPQNLHLTLAFLGECSEKQAAAAQDIVSACNFEPFDIVVEKMRVFQREGGGIWWAGVRPDKPLLALQKQLTQLLKDNGFVLENRRYQPHITLGREVVTEVEPWHFAAFGESVCGIDLMKSERVKGKLIYTKISCI